MKIYKDAFTSNPHLGAEDEVASDTYPQQQLHDGVILEIQSKTVVKSDSGEYNIGSNPSAEESGETYEANSVTVNLLVDAHRLQETSYDKKAYTAYIKNYVKKLLDKVKKETPEREKAFQAGASAWVKNVLEHFSDYTFYTGESMEPEGMVILLGYKEDGVTPYFYFFKDGLIEEKV